jgi:hypothetical protein
MTSLTLRTSLVMFTLSACEAAITKDTVVFCDPGFVADGDACVPEACGTGTWGALPVDEATVHVDASAAGGGDGREEAPLTSIQAGLDLAGASGGGLVAVAAGTYTEILCLNTDHAGVHLAGRCRDMVVLDASGAGGDDVGIEIDAGTVVVEVSGLTVSASSNVGVRVGSGQVTLRGLRVAGSAHGGLVVHQGGLFASSVLVEETEVVGSYGRGLLVLEGGAEVSLVSSAVRGTLPDAGGQGGYGVEVADGASLDMVSSVIEGNTAAGLIAAEAGTQVNLSGVTVSDTLPASNGSYGYGIQVSGGASLEAADCVFARNRTEGLVAAEEGTSVVLTRTSIRDTGPDERGNSGYGMRISDGATLQATSCELAGNQGYGVLVNDPGTTVTLNDTTVSGTLSDQNSGQGSGILVTEGATLELEGCLVDNNVGSGIAVQDAGTMATLQYTTIRDGQSAPGESSGYGIEVAQGARLQATSCDIADNSQIGIFITGAGTMATLTYTDVRGTRFGESGDHGVGVEVNTGGKVTLASCNIEGNAGAGLLVADPGTQASLEDVRVAGSLPATKGDDGFGVQASNGASLELAACDIAGNTTLGLLAQDEGTSVALFDTVIRDTQPALSDGTGFGAEVWGGATVRLESSSIEGNTGLGIAVGFQGTYVELVDSRINNTLPEPDGEAGYALQAWGGSIVVAEASEFSANTALGIVAADVGTEVVLRDSLVADTRAGGSGGDGYGIEVIRGAQLEATSCVVDGSVNAGICAFDAGTLVSLRDCSVTNTKRNDHYTVSDGIVAQYGATVEAQDVSVTGTEGPGLLSTADGSSLSCTGCTVEDSQFAAAVVVHGASLRLEGSSLSGTAESVDLGGGVGVYADPWEGEPPSLVLQDTTVQDNPIAGVWLSGSGSYELVGNSIEGGSGETLGSLVRCGDAVFAHEGTTSWDGSHGLLLDRNTLSHGLGAGLFLDDASATLDSNTWEDNAVDLRIQGNDCSTEPEGFDEEPLASSELCPVYDLPTCGDAFSLYLTIDTPEDVVAPERPPAPVLPTPLRGSLPRPSVVIGEQQLVGRAQDEGSWPGGG